MPWHKTPRNDGRRYATRDESNVTDNDWAIIEPMIPHQGRTGCPRKKGLREAFNAIQ